MDGEKVMGDGSSNFYTCVREESPTRGVDGPSQVVSLNENIQKLSPTQVVSASDFEKNQNLSPTTLVVNVSDISIAHQIQDPSLFRVMDVSDLSKTDEIEDPTQTTTIISQSTMTPIDISNISMPIENTSTPQINNVERKKRGRPRLFSSYVSTNSSNSPSVPISSAPPPPAPPAPRFSDNKQKRGEPEKHIVEDNTIGYLYFDKGEDICSQLYWYATNMQKNICVMSATGSISQVTLQIGDNYLSTSKYEGLFKIVSLSGLILPIRPNTTDSTIAAQQGGLIVAFEDKNGRYLNGCVSSSLIAYGKIQVEASLYEPRPGEFKTWEEMQESSNFISSTVPSSNFQSNSQWVTSTTNPLVERSDVTSKDRFVGQGSQSSNQKPKVRIYSPRGLLMVSLVQGKKPVAGNDNPRVDDDNMSEQSD